MKQVKEITEVFMNVCKTGERLRSEMNSILEQLKKENDMKQKILEILKSNQSFDNTANALLAIFNPIKEELNTTNELLNERQKLLDAIPECPLHGKCIPNALAWIEKHKNKENPIKNKKKDKKLTEKAKELSDKEIYKRIEIFAKELNKRHPEYIHTISANRIKFAYNEFYQNPLSGELK